MNKLLCYSLISCFLTTSVCAQKVWEELSVTSKKQELLKEGNYPSEAKVFSLSMNGLKNQLINAPERGRYGGTSNLIISVPNADGDMMRYRIEEASVFTEEMQAKYPEIRSYAGYGIDDPSAYLRFSISPYKGVSGIVFSGRKGGALIIDPLKEDVTKIVIFRRADKEAKRGKFECATVGDFTRVVDKVVDSSNEILAADDSILRTFDIAISVTGEYVAYHGGTLAGANAAIAATMTRVNGVFEKELNANMVIVAGNDSLVFLDAASDPYGPTDANYSTEIQAELDATIGSGNYDIGHLMSAIGNNGSAGCIGCVCVDGSKGSAFTTSTAPNGDDFDIDLVAHEIGHQFGGQHTFTHISEGAGTTQMEPGSGSTIMGYSGNTDATDMQPRSDPYFHAISIDQITTLIKSSDCDVETATGNINPVVDAGADITLPVGTPFKLSGGSAIDADLGEVLTYCWEQFNEDDAIDAYPDPSVANNNRPLFRSYNPTFSSERTFPFMTDLLANGVNGNIWEKVPTVGRTADFRLTVRDNRMGGANNSFDDMIVTWDASKGPLEVTSQSTSSLMYNQGASETVTWNVNNTDLMTGAANVDILLSTDGGITFPTLLAIDVANDGSEVVTIPNTPAPYCRIMIRPTGAPFFAVNTVAFAIDYIVSTSCTQYSSGAVSLAIPDGQGGGGSGGQVTNVINISNTDAITDINVNVDITHARVSDLVFSVTHPDATRTLLWNEDCGAQVALDITFDDEGAAVVCGANGTSITGIYAPSFPLSKFDGKVANGNWIITLEDILAANTGTLNNWYVEVCSETTTTLGINNVAFEEFVLFPNPNKSSFSISLTSSSGRDIKVFIHDISGRRIYENSFINNATFIQDIKAPNTQSGIYFVTVTDGDRKEVRKIIIE